MSKLKKTKKRQGWEGEPKRHGLAAKGIKTTANNVAAGVPRSKRRKYRIEPRSTVGDYTYTGYRRSVKYGVTGYDFYLWKDITGQKVKIPLYIQRSLDGKAYNIIIPKYANDKYGVRSKFIRIENAHNIPHAFWKFWKYLEKNPTALEKGVKKIE